MQVMQFPDFVLVAFDNPLYFWLESFDSLRSDFVDPFLLPLLAPDLLARHPSLLVLFQFNFIALLNDFLLFLQVAGFVLLLSN